MRIFNAIMVFSTFCLAFNLSLAEAVGDYREAVHIVVITDDEGIHYARGCAFYNLRDQLIEGVDNIDYTHSIDDSPLYEIRLLGKFGEETIYVGDHWLNTQDGTSLLSSATYDRVVALIENRIGSGVAKAKVDSSIEKALDRILDPLYVEDNRCSKQ